MATFEIRSLCLTLCSVWLTNGTCKQVCVYERQIAWLSFHVNFILITERNHVLMPVWSASKPGVDRRNQIVWPVSRTKLCKNTPNMTKDFVLKNGLNTAVKTLQPSQKGSIVSCGWTRDYHSLLFLCWNDVEVRNIRWNMRQATPSSRLEYKMATLQVRGIW